MCINIIYETKGCVYYVRIFFNVKKFTLLHSIISTCIISHFACSGHPDLFNYAQTSVFNVKYLGHLKNVSPQSGRLSSAENQTVTLEAIDTAQVQTACIYYTSHGGQNHDKTYMVGTQTSKFLTLFSFKILPL